MVADKTKNRILHILCVSITIAFVIVTLLFFSFSLFRLVCSFRDLASSFVYYFCELFGIESSMPITILTYPLPPVAAPTPPVDILPPSYVEFKPQIAIFFTNLFYLDNFLFYLYNIMFFIGNAVPFLMLFIPVVIALIYLLKIMLRRENNNYNKDTKPLIVFKKISSKTYIPIKAAAIAFKTFLTTYKAYMRIWFVIALVAFNACTVLVELAAYYFYFVASFDLLSLYIILVKLVKDLAITLQNIPVLVWIVLALILVNRWRNKLGMFMLLHNEMRDRAFIDSTPICVMFVGTVGTGKTSLLTDIALSQEVMFRDVAFKKILEQDLKFSNFPWINLENEIKRAIDKHSIFTLATCRRFASSKKHKFLRKPCKQNCFMYDYNKYGYTYQDNLNLVSIWDVISTYTQLYFIYTVQSSLLVSNYSIRVDNLLDDLGNFPLWTVDFFGKRNMLEDSYNRHSHILDMDMLRLGKKVLENNKKENAFEFGAVIVTEIAKERGNMLDTMELKKGADKTNQKNDLFINWLKLCRHSATVDNFPFVKVLCDDQRPESLGADARELCQIVHIRAKSTPKLAMPFFFIETLAYDIFSPRFKSFYYDYRFSRGDNTLMMYAVKTLFSKFYNYYTKTHNQYGYNVLTLENEDGTLDKRYDSCAYYLSHKKVYADRFATDCFSDYFTEKALKSDVGINDLDEFANTRATLGELVGEHSYFMTDLMTHRELAAKAQLVKLEQEQTEKRYTTYLTYLNSLPENGGLDKVLRFYEFKQKLAQKMSEDEILATEVLSALENNRWCG